MTDFAISNLPAPAGTLQYAELFAPPGGEFGGEIAAQMLLTESPAGIYSGTTPLAPEFTDNLTAPYTYAVRQVDTPDSAGFDASSITTVSGDYGYLSGGIWYGVPPLGPAVGFWTTQAAVQRTYGVFNLEADADLSDDGTGTAAVWQQALNSTDARIDLLLASYLKTRPASQSGTAYTFVSEVAAAQVRYILHKGRGQTEANAAGGPNVGGVYKKEADDLWEKLVGYLDEQVIDFPDVTDTAGAIAGTAPVMLRPTVDAEGRTLVSAADYDRPYYDSNLGAYRW